ncbi:MAG: peptidase [Devosia sp. 67-54]|uniref:imelysin family protein n=1 Tax=unclassified Devosia TaxID=196773 RepID=UPI0009666B9F|nr:MULTISPECIES: imelysin family protein [unclassified Devosia]MBN9303581.1 peptidase [Devosia sp.]OJX17475.1 MAG: peptidase [Devosia sp. 67-54]
MRALGFGVVLGACALALPALAADISAEAVMKNYAAIALAGYSDALTKAEDLDTAVKAFLANPTDDTLKAARQAYIDSRPPYQQTEAFRFGNPVVDDWEGRVNAWPLDEGLMDYVDTASYGAESDENPLYTANVIANKTVLINGKEVDASNLTPEFLSGTLQEAGGIEANVATGYHAIEFLLWGQDLHGTGPGAGERPATDYDLKACTHGNCDRRAQYLQSAVDLLVSDLKEMVGDWQEGGAALKSSQETGLKAILTGMGSLSYGELAGERMKLGLLLHDPEEEHECFSDTTYLSLMNDAKGIQNVYLGKYTRVDGSVVEGPSMSEVVANADPALDTEIRGLLDATMAKFDIMKTRGDTIEKYDQMIGEGNTEGNKVVQDAIDALIAQTRGIERAVALLKLDVTVEGSDSLDNPNAVFK